MFDVKIDKDAFIQFTNGGLPSSHNFWMLGAFEWRSLANGRKGAHEPQKPLKNKTAKEKRTYPILN